MRLPPLVAALSLLGLSAQATAQTQTYPVRQYGAPYVPITGGTAVPIAGGLDDGAGPVQIGFTFRYFDVDYTVLNVGVDGLLDFAAPCGTGMPPCQSGESCNVAQHVCRRSGFPYTPQNPANSPSPPNRLLAPLWNDLDLQTAGTPPLSRLLYQTNGSAPNRTLTIQYENLRRHPLGAGHALINFQVILYETSNVIRFHYGPYVSGTDNAAIQASIEIKSTTGTNVIPGHDCSGPPMWRPACTYMTLQSLVDQVIELGAPDAPQLTGAVFPPSNPLPGDTVPFILRADNIGRQPTETEFEAQVFLSSRTGTVSPLRDTRLGTVMFDALDPLASATATLTAQIPAATVPGYYTVGALFDSGRVVQQASRAGNLVISPQRLLIGNIADFRIALRSFPRTNGPGEPLGAVLELRNIGHTVPEVGWEVRLTRNVTMDPVGVRVASGTKTLTTTAAESLTPFTVTSTIPNITPGAYYLIAIVNPGNVIPSADPMNNRAVSTMTMTLLGADLVAVSVQGPTTAFRGHDYPVTFVLQNNGQARARDFRYAFYFAESQLITVFAHQLGEFGPITLLPGQRVMMSARVAVPATLAQRMYYLGLIADTTDAVMQELPQHKITRQLDPVLVRDTAPQFVVSSIEPQPTAIAGQTLTVQRTLDNSGNAPGTAPYLVLLSANRVIDPARILSSAMGTVSLPAGGLSADIDRLRIPGDTAPGNYYVGYWVDPDETVDQLSRSGNRVVANMAIEVISAQLSIRTRELPLATTGTPYQIEFSATGGSGPYVWSLASGMLPDGLSLDASGKLSGTPTAEGMSTFHVGVTDGTLSIDKAFTLLVTAPTTSLQILTAAVPPAIVGRPYEFPLTAVGGVLPYLWSAQGRPPPRIRLSDDGKLAGTATAAGSAVVNFRVTDATHRTSERPIVVRAILETDSVHLATDALPDGVVNQVYPDVPLRAVRGQAPYVFDVGDGALPDGLSIDGNTLAGTPRKVGLFAFQLRVTDARGGFDLNRYVVNIADNNGVRFVTKALPKGVRDADYLDALGGTVRLRAVGTGTTSAIRFSLLSSGQLPPGLQLEPDGRIHGKPSMAGVSAFTVAATDSTGQMDLRAFGIAVDDPPMMMKASSKSGGCSCEEVERGGSSHALASMGLVLLLGGLFALRRKWSAVAFGVGLAIAGGGSASAQTMPSYRISNYMEPYVHRTGGMPLTFIPSTTTGQATLILPFMFHFFSNDYGSIVVGTKGYATFGTNGTSGSPHTLPNTVQPTNLIAVFWENLQTQSGTVNIEGAAPNRVAVIQWAGVQRAFTSGFSWEMQLWLYEGRAGQFELHFGPTTGSPTIFIRGVSGFENLMGNMGGMFLSCNAQCQASDVVAQNNRVYRAIQDGGPLPFAASVRAPFRVYQDIPFAVSSSIASLHATPIGPFVYTVHLLSPGEQIPSHPIFTSMPITLGIFEARGVSDQVTIPGSTQPGRYRLALETDSAHQIPDPDRSSTIVISRGDVIVSERLPDFSVPGVSVVQTMAAPGTSIPVTVRIRNSGNAAGSSAWKLYLSHRHEVTIDNRAIHEDMVDLQPGATATITASAQIPSDVTPGRYYLGVIVDPDNRVREIDKLNNTGVTSTPITIGLSSVGLASTVIPGANVGIDYSTFLRATGGDGSYAFAIGSGMLPAGLLLDPSSGEIHGKPTAPGTSTFSVSVTSNGETGEGMLSLEVAEIRGELTIVTRDLIPGVLGQAYPPHEPGLDRSMQQHVFAVGGAGPAMFSLGTALSLPAGLVLDSDGYVHGVPQLTGHFDVDVRATDGMSMVSRDVALTVVEPGQFSIVHTSLPIGQVDQFYDYQLLVIGRHSTATVTYSLTDDPRTPIDEPPGTVIHDKRLPDGLALTSIGRITGTPRRVGTWRFAVEASEGMGPTALKSAGSFSLTVQNSSVFQITPTSLPNAVLNKPYLAALEVGMGAGTPPFVWRTIGQQPFPPGLKSEIVQKESRETLRIYGTPTALPEPVEDVQVGGLISFLVTVTDSIGRRAQQEIALRVVEEPKAAPAMAAKKSGCGCSAAPSPVAGGRGVTWPLVMLGCAILIVCRRMRFAREEARP